MLGNTSGATMLGADDMLRQLERIVVRIRMTKGVPRGVEQVLAVHEGGYALDLWLVRHGTTKTRRSPVRLIRRAVDALIVAAARRAAMPEKA